MSKVILIFNTLLAFTSPGVQGANTDSHLDKLPRLVGIMFEFNFSEVYTWLHHITKTVCWHDPGSGIRMYKKLFSSETWKD